MSEENALFGSIGDGRDPDAELQPRANKPGMYSLYIDGQHVDGYVSAYAALQGLRDAAGDRHQKIELREDMDGAKVAEKRLVDVNNTTNLLRSAHAVPKLYLTDDMKRDLISEGRDPAHPFRDVQPARTHEASVWFKQLQSITAQLKHERAANVERERAATPNVTRPTPAMPDRQVEAKDSPQQASASKVVKPAKQAAAQTAGWFTQLQSVTAELERVRESSTERSAVSHASQSTPAVPSFLAKLQAMQAPSKPVEQQPDSTFQTIVSPPDAKPRRAHEMDIN